MASRSCGETQTNSDDMTFEGQGQSQFSAVNSRHPRVTGPLPIYRTSVLSSTDLAKYSHKDEHAVWEYARDSPSLSEDELIAGLTDLGSLRDYLGDLDSIQDGKIEQELPPAPDEQSEQRPPPTSDENEEQRKPSAAHVGLQVIEILLSYIWYATDDHKKANRAAIQATNEIQRLAGLEQDSSRELTELRWKTAQLHNSTEHTYKTLLAKVTNEHKKYKTEQAREFQKLELKFDKEMKTNERIKHEKEDLEHRNKKIFRELETAKAALDKDIQLLSTGPLEQFPNDLIKLRAKGEELNKENYELYGEVRRLEEFAKSEQEKLTKLEAKQQKALESYQSDLSQLKNQISSLQVQLDRKKALLDAVQGSPSPDGSYHNIYSPRDDPPTIKLPGSGILLRTNRHFPSESDNNQGGLPSSLDRYRNDPMFLSRADGRDDKFNDNTPRDPQNGLRRWKQEWYDPLWNPLPGISAGAFNFQGRASLPEELRPTSPLRPQVTTAVEPAQPSPGQLLPKHEPKAVPPVPIAPQITEQIDRLSSSLDSTANQPGGSPERAIDTAEASKSTSSTQAISGKPKVDDSMDAPRQTHVAPPFPLRPTATPEIFGDVVKSLASQLTGSAPGTFLEPVEQMLSPTTMDAQLPRPNSQETIEERLQILEKQASWPLIRQPQEIGADVTHGSKSHSGKRAMTVDEQRRPSLHELLDAVRGSRRGTQDSQKSDASKEETQPQAAKPAPTELSTSREPRSTITPKSTITYAKGTKEPKELSSPRIVRKNLPVQQWPFTDGSQLVMMIICMMLMLAIILFCSAARGAWTERRVWLQANDISDAQRNYLAAAEKLWEFKHSLRGNDYLSSFLTAYSGSVVRGYLG